MAGMSVAAAPVAASARAAATSASGLVGARPNSIDRAAVAAATATTLPVASPAASEASERRATIPMMAACVAPSASRTPISWRRRTSGYDSTP